MYLQRTIKHPVECSSVGLHSGRKVSMRIMPADIDAGITFVRADLPQHQGIKADIASVCDTTLATTIGNNGSAVSTVEHLMSAFSGMGVDNAVVEVNAPEVPIMDGSALPFVNLLRSVGTRTQGKCKKLLVIKKAISVEDDTGTVMMLPASEFKITYKIDFKHPVIGQQSYHLTFSDVNYEKEICAARTFGFLKDVEYLQARGLALGGSLKNAIVLNDQKIINKEGLRCPEEFVKHKILDAIGDLSLLGMPIIGHFIAYKSGHKLNNFLLREILAHEECWSIVNHFPKEDPVETSPLPLNVPAFRVLDAINA